MFFFVFRAEYYWLSYKIVFTLISSFIFITFLISFILELRIFINESVQNSAKPFIIFMYVSLRLLLIFIFHYYRFFSIIFLICIFINSFLEYCQFILFFYVHVHLKLMSTQIIRQTFSLSAKYYHFIWIVDNTFSYIFVLTGLV